MHQFFFSLLSFACYLSGRPHFHRSSSFLERVVKPFAILLMLNTKFYFSLRDVHNLQKTMVSTRDGPLDTSDIGWYWFKTTILRYGISEKVWLIVDLNSRASNLQNATKKKAPEQWYDTFSRNPCDSRFQKAIV